MTRRPAAKFSRATAEVVSMEIAIHPVDKSLIVVIEPSFLALDEAATLARFFSHQLTAATLTPSPTCRRERDFCRQTRQCLSSHAMVAERRPFEAVAAFQAQPAARNGIFVVGDRRPKACPRNETYAQRRKSRPHDREKPAENWPFRRQVFHGEFRWTGWSRTWDPLIKSHFEPTGA